MSSAAKILRSRGFMFTAALIFLLALVWVVPGLLLGLGTLVCLIAACGVLVLFSLFLIFDQAKAAKNASNLERSIFEQSEEQKASARPEKREEIENLRQQLVASIQKLKKSKLGQGRKGAAALYALPWYMIIGPPAAGKTTAIRNSGLEFPFGTDREIQGVGGTRNCDWWFSNSAIILDTAGRYVTEDEDQEEWTAFLDILKKNRSRQPINGVLVCISVADLLNATHEEMEWHARTIRKRIDELTQRLGLRFPVYLLFTKCDLFNGFVQFFEEFSRAQREQIWGCTFSGEQLDDRTPGALFEREYQALYDGLVSTRFARLAPGIKREDRSVIFAFPMEFLAAKENLSFFVNRVFQPNPYQESPVFRGFYFTSGTQEGVPIDRVIQSMAQAFGLSPQAKQELNPEIQAKSYFIRDLFTEVIIPDEHLVRPTSHVAKSRRLFRVGAGVASVLLLAIAVLGMTQAYFRSKAQLDAAVTDVAAFKASSIDPADLAPRLDILLNRIQVLQNPPFFLFGMDKSRTLQLPMQQLYFRQIHPFIYAGILQPLQARLSGTGSSRTESYDNLKTYLLLTTERARLGDDEKNRQYLARQLEKLADPKFAPQMKPHLEYFAKNFGEAVDDGLAQPFSPDLRTIAQARSSAGKLDIPGIYENLKRKVADLPPYVANPQVFAGGSEVRGIFTSEGYKALDQLVDNSEFMSLGAEAKWVLALESNQMQGTFRNPSQIGDSLRRMYLRDYAAEWSNYLAGLRIAPFDNLSDAANRMKLYSDPQNSPIKQLLKDVVANTTFTAAAEKGLMDKAEKPLPDKVGKQVASLVPANYVEREFTDAHRFAESDPDNGKPGEIDGLLTLLGKVSDELDLLASAPAAEAKTHAAAVYAGNDPLVDALREIRRSSRGKDDRIQKVLANLFEQPVRYAWKVLIDRSMDYFNDTWHRDVYEPYRQLKTYYPFDPGGQDAPLSEVAAIFADNGKLAKFVETDLKAFVDEDHGWDAKTWEGGDGITLSSAARNALTQAKTLRASLFHGPDPGMKVDLKLEPLVRPDGATQVDILSVKIGGKEQRWSLNDEKPPEFVFDWPGDGGCSIRLVKVGGKVLGLFGSSDEKTFDEKSYDGGWALFRLVSSSAKSSGSGRAEVHCVWTFKEGIVASGIVKTDKGFNNPLARNLSIDLPEKLN